MLREYNNKHEYKVFQEQKAQRATVLNKTLEDGRD